MIRTNGLFMSVSVAVGSIVVLLAGVFADRYGFIKTDQVTAALSPCAILFTFFIKDAARE